MPAAGRRTSAPAEVGGAGRLTLTFLHFEAQDGPDPGEPIRPISFKRRRFPPDAIKHAVWLYLRFTLSIRDVEELMAHRGIVANREAVRCWVNKFGPLIACLAWWASRAARRIGSCLCAFNRRKPLAASIMPAAVQHKAIRAFRHRLTLRQTRNYKPLVALFLAAPMNLVAVLNQRSKEERRAGTPAQCRAKSTTQIGQGSCRKSVGPPERSIIRTPSRIRAR